MKNRANVLVIEADTTDDEIVEIIRHHDKLLVERRDKDGYQLTVHGYDDDPRELHEIPEAVDLLRRFVALGGIGLLTLSTQTDLMGEHRPAITWGLGAVEVWAIAKGHIRGVGLVRVPLVPFLADYDEAIVKYHMVVEATAA